MHQRDDIDRTKDQAGDSVVNLFIVMMFAGVVALVVLSVFLIPV
jgi:hypothetical protein